MVNTKASAKDSSETKYWCLNFDNIEVLNYGLTNNMWLMQYQYSHGGQINQGHKIPRITANWKAAARIKPGDLCVAYLKRNKFFAIGEVIAPRKKMTCQDTLYRALGGQPVTERRHLHYDGVVCYTDAAGAFYEDHSDTFSVTWTSSDYEEAQPETYSYPQRIDVGKWQYARKDEAGSYKPRKVPGLAAAAAAVKSFIQDAAFQIDEGFFRRIEQALL